MWKIIRRIFLGIVIILVCLVGYITWDGYQVYQKAVKEISIEDRVNKIRQDENYVKIQDLPKMYVDAVIAVEDHRFREHGAIDIISIIRAIYNNIRMGKLVEGGSTITQQLAKNIVLTQEQTATRKIAEIFAGMELESKYSKDEILELYVNTLYCGDGYYGIGEGAKGYFKKEAKDMNEYESTMIAGIPNAPSVYSLNVNPDLAKKRHKKVLSAMVEEGYLTQEQADEIFNSNDNKIVH